MYTIQDQIRKSVFREFSRCTQTSRMPSIALHAGDIAAVLDLKILKQAIRYVMRNTRLFSNQWTFPDPVIGYAIEPKTQADVDKLGMAIAKLVEEDPTLKFIRTKKLVKRY